MKEYWEILRELREDRDLKQSAVASVLGTTQQVYSRYENGINEMPIRHLRTLCELLQRQRGLRAEPEAQMSGGHEGLRSFAHSAVPFSSFTHSIFDTCSSAYRVY